MVCYLLIFSTCRECAYIKVGFLFTRRWESWLYNNGHICCFCPRASVDERDQAKEPKSGCLSKEAVGKSDVVDVIGKEVVAPEIMPTRFGLAC